MMYGLLKLAQAFTFFFTTVQLDRYEQNGSCFKCNVSFNEFEEFLNNIVTYTQNIT